MSHGSPCVLAVHEDTLDWTTCISDEWNMSMNYPTSFKTEEITHEFKNGADLMIYSDEPYVSVTFEYNVLDMTFSKYNHSKDTSRIHEQLLSYDDFIAEDINITKWKIDDQNALSFIFASGENAYTGTVTTSEVIYIFHNNTSIMIKFTAFYNKFDTFQIQELEKRMIASIELF